MSTEFNKVKSGVTFTKAAQKQDLQSGDTIPEALGKLAKYMDVTDDALSNIQPILTFDSEPKYESLNPVTSGGLYDYIELQSPTYINTFSTESDLYNYSGNLTNNDYAFVGTGSGATYYMNVYQYKSEVIRDTIENIKTVPSGSNILKTLNEPALPSGNIQYKLDCYVTAVNNQSYGTSPVISVIFSDNTTAQVTVPNANKTHIVKTYCKTIKAIQFMNSGQASDGYTDFEDIQILTTAGWNKLSYRLYNPTWDANQLSAINSGITSTKVTNYDNHIANKSNPHEVTKSQVGLGNVGNFKAVSTEASQGLTNTEQSNARTNINAQESLSFNGTYNASTNKVATESTVTDAINALDVSSQGGAGKYISKISETNGKISATPTTMDTSLSNSSTNNNCPTSKTVYDDQQRQDAALAEVENKGAKNLFPYGDLVEITSNFSDKPIFIKAGSYRIRFYTSSTTGSYAIRIKDASDNSLFYVTHNNTSTEQRFDVELSADAAKITFYSSASTDFTGIMICTKAEWDISQAYVQYGKTNAELTSDISALSTENTRQETEIGIVANAGAKNNFNIASPNAIDYKTTHSISDDSVTITGSAGFSRYVVPVSLKAGSYIFTATVNSISTSGRVRFNTASDGTGTNVTSQIDFSQSGSISREFTINQDTAFFVMIYSSTSSTDTASTLVISQCMIRPASITDSTFVPYAKTNVYLTNENVNQQLEINYAINTGVKNLLPMTHTNGSITRYGVTCTWNDDGTMTLNGSHNSGDSSAIFEFYDGSAENTKILPAGSYVLTGCPAGGSTSSYRAALSQITGAVDVGNGATFELSEPHYAAYRIIISGNVTLNNMVFKPMIRPAAITDPTYEPYGKTNAELTSDISALSTENTSQQAEINYAVNAGVKNLFDINETPIVNHTTYTLTDEKLTVIADGTWAHYSVPIDLPEGNYILSLIISDYSKASGAPDTSMRMRMAATTSGVTYIMLQTITGNGAINVPFTWTGGTIYLQFYPNFNATAYANSFSAADVMIRPASITDDTFVPYGKTNAELTAENTSQQAEINYAINTGAKNFVWYDREVGRQYTTQGRTFTILPDGGIEITGNNVTQTNADFYLNGLWTTTNVIFDLSDKDYYISLSDNIGSAVAGIMFRALNRSTGSTEASYSATLATRQRILKDKITTIFITVTTAVTLPSDGIIVYPMIRPAAITDDTFVPYALSNPVLTPAAIKAVDEGAKNICNWSADTSTIENVTFTINPDKTVSASGTATARSQKALTFTVPSTLKAGRYVLSGCPTGGAQSGTVLYCLYIWDNTANARVCSNDTGNGIEFDWTPDASHTYSLAVDVRSGTNASGLIFKPMICTAADWNVSKKFVPYAPTNRELYEEKIGIEDVFGVRPQIADNTDLNTLQTIGKYVCGGLAKAQTLLNCPMQGAFIMLVDAVGALTRLIQRIYGFDTNTGKVLIYIRALTINGWGSWYKFEGTEVTS